ncbi:3-hydroxyacyl-[acyl-carrier-protein] dehydratase, FabZ form [hydrothermal vent metagenome]|uniref:3-hydroxyacyl-[acyl-carrier-protein] dehydratase n=1 Tax=hydrothermal vent metagenome TaxID=652676 RepID=A0A3B1BWX2_9ZZZZ
MIIEHHELGEYIPHRHPFLLVDRIIEIEANKKAVGIKNVTGSEYFFPGHFPGRPVMPGVLIVEALAQTAAVLAIYSTPENKGALIYFAGIDKARFKKPVAPGDVIRLEIEVIKTKSRLWKVKGEAYVEDSLVCGAGLTAMIESRKT